MHRPFQAGFRWAPVVCPAVPHSPDGRDRGLYSYLCTKRTNAALTQGVALEQAAAAVAQWLTLGPAAERAPGADA